MMIMKTVKRQFFSENQVFKFSLKYIGMFFGITLLAERYDTKSNIKLGGFRPQPQASYVSSHTEEL